jgi:hypothetical protein
LILVLFVINLAYLYRLTVEVEKANERLQHVEEVVEKVALDATHPGKGYVDTRELQQWAERAPRMLEEFFDEVDLEDLLRDALAQIENEAATTVDTEIETK